MFQRDTWAVYTRLLRYVRPYTGRLSIAGFAYLVQASTSLVFPLVVQRLVDDVLTAGDRVILNWLAGGLLLMFTVQALASYLHIWQMAFISSRVIRDIRLQIYTHLQSLSLRYFADNRTGELVSRLTSDVTLLQRAITDDILQLIRQVLTLVGAAILLFYLNWQLTLLILVMMPLVGFSISRLGRRIRENSKEAQDELAEVANVIEETISGVRMVKSFAREGYENQRFAERINAVFDASLRRDKIRAVLSPIIGLIAFVSLTLAFWVGSRQVISGVLSIGELVAYLFYTLLISTPVASLSGLYSQFQSAIGATEKLFALLDTKPDIADAPDAVTLPAINGNVRFSKVSFDYVEQTAILKSIDFDAEAGQVIALVGPSGAGKSTLVNLIPRFYDVGAGAILIDEHDIRTVKVQSLRDQIGIVPQETTLFSDTVRANIRYGKLDATQAEIEAAAQAANAHTFISDELPNGYDTLVGERGVKLSGGQRQRVSIARALLKDPRILILDEATSSLDSESEHLVQEALERLMVGRTTFVIAHRLSTIINADCILVLDQGTLVEHGTHADLLAQNGLYARLHAMQFEK